MSNIKKEYLKSSYWDKRATTLLNQNLSFSDNIKRYVIQRKIDIIDFFIQKLKPKKVSSIGCGVGNILIPMAKKYPWVNFYGVDFSIKNLNVIFEQIMKRSLTNLMIFENLAWELPFKNNNIDFLFCLDVLYHLTLSQKVSSLIEFNRVSKKSFANFRGEEITNVFYYDFLFRKLHLPKKLHDKFVIYYTEKNEIKISDLNEY